LPPTHGFSPTTGYAPTASHIRANPLPIITAPPEGLIQDNSFINPKIQLRYKSDGSKGVFATAPIPTGEIVSILTGDAVTGAELARLPEESQRQSLQLAPDIYQVLTKDPRHHPEYVDITAFFNHSCNPNMVLKGNNVLAARRNIVPGEELRFDYGTSDTQGNPDRGWSCDCGASSCRGRTTPLDYRMLVPYYGPTNVAEYLRRMVLDEQTKLVPIKGNNQWLG